MEDFDLALLQLTAEIAAHPTDPEPLVERGNLYAEAGRYLEAIEDYSRVIALAPDCELAYDNRGVARLYLLDYYAALADFSQAVTLAPDYYYSWANRAYVYALLERPEWALNDARQALKLCPDLAPAYDVMGQAYRQLGRLELALESFNRAIALDPACVQAPYHRATVWQALGQADKARIDLLNYLSLHDDQQNAASRQAQARQWLLQLEQA